MAFSDFTSKQQEVYDRFRNTSKLKKQGIVPSISIQQGGYLIIYRHSPRITDVLGEFSHRVSRIVLSIICDSKNAHTTIFDFKVSDNFPPESNLLKTITRVVSTYLPLQKKYL